MWTERRKEMTREFETNRSGGGGYVTFSWLIGACGSVLVAVITIALFTIGWVTSALDKKVDKEVFSYYCKTMSEIKSTVESNEQALTRVDRNQIRVMQKLGISPEQK